MQRPTKLYVPVGAPGVNVAYQPAKRFMRRLAARNTAGLIYPVTKSFWFTKTGRQS